jgi:hypothetical protein
MTSTLMIYNVIPNSDFGSVAGAIPFIDSLTVGGILYEAYQITGYLHHTVEFTKIGTTYQVSDPVFPVGVGGVYQKRPFGDPLSWNTGCYEIFNNDSLPIQFRSREGFSIPMGPITIAPGTSLYFYIDATTLAGTTYPSACCVRGDVLVKTKQGAVPIKDVRAGDIVYKSDGSEINVQYNIKFVPTKSFVKISKGSLAQNVPDSDIFITGEHPVNVNDKEINAQDLVNGTTIQEKEIESSEPIYSLCTAERTSVLMNNLLVFTWGDAEWNEFSTKNKIWSTRQ